MGPLAALIRKEFIQVGRRTPLFILVVWTLAVEIVICAYSISYDVTHLPLAVQDLDDSPASRELVSRFAQTEYFDVGERTWHPRELDDLLANGRAAVGLVIPPEFSRRVGQRLPASVQLLMDGSNSNSALIALGYATRIVGQYSRDVEIERGRVTVGTNWPVRNSKGNCPP